MSKFINFEQIKTNIFNKKNYYFFLIFFISYILLISLGYFLAKGNIIYANAIKSFLIDMIFVSFFIAIGGGLWQNKNLFYTKFIILTLVVSIHFIINYITVAKKIVQNAEFSANIAFFVFLSYFAIILLVLLKFYILRILALSLFIIPSLIFFIYFIQTGIMLEEQGFISMLITNLNEALEYISATYNSSIILTIILFIIIIMLFMTRFQNLKFSKFDISFFIRIIFLCFIIFILSIKINFVSLNFYANLFSKTEVFFKITQKFANNTQKRINSVKDLNFKNENGLYVLVIGESQNKNYMSAYGYKYDTTPFLKNLRNNENSIFFTNAFSNYTLTIPALFQFITEKNQYNEILQEEALSLIEIANLANFETILITNQAKYGNRGNNMPLAILFSQTKQKFFLRQRDVKFFIDETNFDEEIVDKIDEVKFGNRTLLILHLMGTHFDYKARYPEDFAKFGSSYDNAMFYSDFVLKEIYEKVSKMPNFKAMVFLSDHGEDMQYQHDPNNFTSQMIQIPFFAYFSDDYISQNLEIFTNLKKHKDDYFTNDLLFNLMCSIMGLKYHHSEPYNDISSKYYDNNKSRFKTLHGSRNIEEIMK